jgi:hypothetical protein
MLTDNKQLDITPDVGAAPLIDLDVFEFQRR